VNISQSEHGFPWCFEVLWHVGGTLRLPRYLDDMDGAPAVGPGSVSVSWSQRYKASLERLSSGDRGQVAEVVRQLPERERTRGLSAGEVRMLARARWMLDGPGDDFSGVREPRRPLQPGGAAGIGLQLRPEFHGAHDGV
jgi:hypothetical protein